VHIYTVHCTDIPCDELTPSIEGTVISNCTSGTPGVGYLGDTCILSYQNGERVMEMWACKANMTWVRVSGMKIFVVNFLKTFIQCIH